MSGHKLTSLKVNKLAAAQITQARLMANLRDAQKQPRLAAIHQQNADEMQTVFAAIEKRQASFEQSLDQLHQQSLRTLEREACQNIHAHQTRLFQNVQEFSNLLWQETGEALASQEHQIEDLQEGMQEQVYHQIQLSEMFAASQQQISDAFYQMHARQEEITENQMHLLDEFQALSQTQHEGINQAERKMQLTTEKLDDAAHLLNFIRNTYDVEKFMAGEAQHCACALEQAHHNLAEDFVETAMSSAQTLYQRLAEMRLTLQQVQAEWELLHTSVASQLRQVLEMAHAMQHIPSFDLDGNDLDQTIDVDYWSGRKFSRLVTALRAMLHRVEQDGGGLTSSALMTFQQETIPSMVSELETICHQAVQEALNSQLRINIADVVVQALESQGFVLSSSSYEQEDKRRSYQAAVRNLGGDEILIGVEPGRHEADSSQLRLISADADLRSEHELQQRATEILDSLHQFGIDSGEIQELPLPAVSPFGRQSTPLSETIMTAHMQQQANLPDHG